MNMKPGWGEVAQDHVHWLDFVIMINVGKGSVLMATDDCEHCCMF